MAKPKAAAKPAVDVKHAAAVWVPVEEVDLWAENPRDNDGEPVRKVAASIKEFGFVSPLVVWPSKNRLVAGNTRLKAYRTLMQADPTFTPPGAPGPGLVPVRHHEFTNDEQANAFAIADNRLSYEADWDWTKLVPMLDSIKSTGQELLDSTGFDTGELDALLRSQWSPSFEPSNGANTPDPSTDAAATPPATDAPADPPRTLTFTASQIEELRGAARQFGPVETDAELVESILAMCREVA